MSRCKYTHNEYFFSHDTPEAFYWAGFIAADGCVVVDKRTGSTELCIELTDSDKVHLEKFQREIQYTGNIRYQSKENKLPNTHLKSTITSERIRITITTSAVKADLMSRFNIVPRKSLIYTFPTWLIDHPLVGHFIRGYFDGDGCLYLKKQVVCGEERVKRLAVSLAGTESFLETCRNILVHSCSLVERPKIIRHGNVSSLTFGGTTICSRIIHFLYSGATSKIWLDRKRDLATDPCIANSIVATKERIRAVIGVNDKTGEVIRFPSSYVAAQKLHVNRHLIYRCLHGERKHTRGLRWEYDVESNQCP